MKRLFPVLTRIFVLLLIVGAGYYFISNASLSQKLDSPLSFITKVTSSLNFDTSKIESIAKEKFVDQQPIISESEKSKVVLGESTQISVSDQVENFVSKTTEAVSQELKNIPKTEAANLLRQTCEQMIAELEK